MLRVTQFPNLGGNVDQKDINKNHKTNKTFKTYTRKPIIRPLGRIRGLQLAELIHSFSALYDSIKSS
jgi:hypothetical protein